MADPIKFQKGLAANLSNLPIESGQIIYTTDDGKLYIDDGESRQLINSEIKIFTISEDDIGSTMQIEGLYSLFLNRDFFIIQLNHYSNYYTLYYPYYMLNISNNDEDQFTRDKYDRTFVAYNLEGRTIKRLIFQVSATDAPTTNPLWHTSYSEYILSEEDSVDTKLSNHNLSTTAHSDIREMMDWIEF